MDGFCNGKFVKFSCDNKATRQMHGLTFQTWAGAAAATCIRSAAPPPVRFSVCKLFSCARFFFELLSVSFSLLYDGISSSFLKLFKADPAVGEGKEMGDVVTSKTGM